MPTEEDRPIIVFSKLLGDSEGRMIIVRDELISTPEDWGMETSHVRKIVLDAFSRKGLELKTRWFGAETNSSTYYQIQKRRGEGLQDENEYFRTMDRVQTILRRELNVALPDGSEGPHYAGAGPDIAVLVVPTSYAGIGTFRLLMLLLVINFCMLLATLFWRK